MPINKSLKSISRSEGATVKTIIAFLPSPEYAAFPALHHGGPERPRVRA
ncbi:unnamed protein product [Brassica oleracea]